MRLRIALDHPDASTPDMDPEFITRLLADYRQPFDGLFVALYPTLWDEQYGGHIGHHDAALACAEEACADTHTDCTVWLPEHLMPGLEPGARWDSAAWSSVAFFPRRFPAGMGLLAAEPVRVDLTRPSPEPATLRMRPVRDAPCEGMALSPDGHTLAVATANEVIVFRVADELRDR